MPNLLVHPHWHVLIAGFYFWITLVHSKVYKVFHANMLTRSIEFVSFESKIFVQFIIHMPTLKSSIIVISWLSKYMGCE